MKVNTETFGKVVDSEIMGVKGSWTGEIALSFGDNSFFFSPRDAIGIWRLMKGEKEAAEIKYVKHGLIDATGKLIIKYEEDECGCRWRLRFTDDFCAILDANEALALSWAIEGQVSMEIWNAEHRVYVPKKEPPMGLWVMSCRRLLTGDCAETRDSNRLGGFERIFVSEELARDSVREVIRGLVNEAYSESYWDVNPDVSVDGIIDSIMDRPRTMIDGAQYWTHDGQTQSFEVKLCLRIIEK